MMRKFTLGVLATFALIATGCCLRVMDTRIGVNCCGIKDSETFVEEVEEKVATNGDDATATATPINVDPPLRDMDKIALFVAGVVILGLVGWNAYKAIQKKKTIAAASSDAGDKQI